MAEQPWGAKQEDWLRFELLDLTSELLPVVSNPNAKISPNSALKTLGKVPSRYTAERLVIGLPEWPTLKPHKAQVELWSEEPDYGICLQARIVRAFDVDVPDKELSNTIQEAIQGELNWLGLPIRSRADSGKLLLAFRLPGIWAKRKLQVKGGIIEFLGDGQMFVAAGTHQNGARYEWQWPEGCSDFPTLTAEEFERVWAMLVKEFAIAPPEEFTANRTKGADLCLADPLADFIRTSPNFLGETDDKILIDCPFKNEHTGESGASETAYFPKGSNGYEEGHFVCMHAHCRGRADSAFELALGYHDNDFTATVQDDFDTLSVAAQNMDSVNPNQVGSTPNRVESDKPNLFPIYSATEYLGRPRPGWIVQGLLPRAEIAAIFGESGSGKTFVGLDLGLAIARGLPNWLGREVSPGRVVYIAAEGAGGFRNRIEAYCVHNNVSLKDVPFQIVPAAPNFLSTDDAVKVAKTVIQNGGKADVIFVDTLAQVTIGGNENAAEDMSKAIANCKGIHLATGATVVLIHHAGKDLERGLRGWSGLKGALDANIEILKGDGNLRTLRVEKMKDGRDGDAWNFVLVDVPLPSEDPFDLDFDEESSSVVQFMGVTQGKKRKDKKSKVKGEFQERAMICWKILSERGPVKLGDLEILIAARTSELRLRNGEIINKKEDASLRKKAERAIGRLRDLEVFVLEDDNTVMCTEA